MLQSRIFRIALALVFVYIAGYVAFRATHRKVWERNGRAYVIFPESAYLLYLAFRPLSYLDGALTGMSTHLGPHLPDQG